MKSSGDPPSGGGKRACARARAPAPRRPSWRELTAASRSSTVSVSDTPADHVAPGGRSRVDCRVTSAARGSGRRCGRRPYGRRSPSARRRPCGIQRPYDRRTPYGALAAGGAACPWGRRSHMASQQPVGRLEPTAPRCHMPPPISTAVAGGPEVTITRGIRSLCQRRILWGRRTPWADGVLATTGVATTHAIANP